MSFHLLFADDNPDTRHMMRLIFNSRLPNAAITLARDGDDAIAFIRTGVPVNLILLDYRMPPDDDGGVRAAREIHRLRPAVPLFFLSAYTLDRTMATARASGAWGYLYKDAIIHPEVFNALVTGDRDAWRRLQLRGYKLQLFEENLPVLP